jgi:hypothetical protein
MSNPSASWEDVASVQKDIIERKDSEIAELRAKLALIEAAASDANEYVLAQINADLRARVAELERENASLRQIPCWVESEDGNPGWGKTADAVEMLGKAYARIEELEKIEMVLRDLLDNISTPTLDDPRLDYVEVQVDREALANARRAIASV